MSDMADKKTQQEALLELGGALRAARKRAGLTQADVCARAQISRDTISRLERGEPVDTSSLLRIASALGYQVTLRPAPLRAADMRRKYAHLHSEST
jgi:transcriptional regulator with XRE-family HTH domain